MNTGHYVTPESLIFNAAGFAGDTKHEYLPRGFYMALIRDAFQQLNMSSKFSEQRVSFPVPQNHLTIALPEDCFDVENVYMYSGTTCDFNVTKKVYWKRHYYTEGQGYVANDKWDNRNDPYFENHSSRDLDTRIADNLKREAVPSTLLYYNIQMGNLMLSSSCRSAGNMVHIQYRGTGIKAMDAPIIPIYFKAAIEDYITEAALRFRMANEPEKAKVFIYLQQLYEKRLDKEGMRGSWHEAVFLAKTMNDSQRNELNDYLSRGGWGTGR